MGEVSTGGAPNRITRPKTKPKMRKKTANLKRKRISAMIFISYTLSLAIICERNR